MINIKRKLAENKAISIVGGHYSNSDLIDFMGQFGFDAFWIECEHGPVTWERIGDLSRACDLWNMACIVRVPSGEPSIITRTLDQGAQGIIVPHVKSAAQARQISEAARFAPLGNRGVYSGCRRAYGVEDHFANANQETLVAILIEDAEALEDLDNILAVPNIDVFSVAPNDLAQSMGHLGNWKHPEVNSAIEDTLRKIAASGKTAGFIVNEELDYYFDLGVRWFHVLWPNWVAQGAREFVGRVSALGG